MQGRHFQEIILSSPPKMKDDSIWQSFVLGGIAGTTMVMLFWAMPDFAQAAAGLWKHIPTPIQIYDYYRPY